MSPRRVALLAVTVAVLAGTAVACSDDGDSSSSSTELVMPTTTTTTTAVGAESAPTSTFVPNTPVIAGQEAILTGAYSQTPRPGGGGDADDPCHYVTADDGAKVSVAFTDTYSYGGEVYPGPPDYPGDPERYADDPLLVHPGNRIAVRGEVVEVGDDDVCAQGTANPGLTILVSSFAPS